MAQRQIPGGAYVNETGTRQAQIPGGPFINETVAAGGGDPALTGQSTTIQQGSVVPSVSPALTGQSTTIQQGSVVPSVSPALTGQSTTIQQGSVVPSVSPALTGQSTTIQQGSLTVDTGTVNLSGQSTTIQQGSVVPSVSPVLSGQSTTIQQGSVVPSVSPALTGQSTTIQQGSLTVFGEAVSRAITGQSISITQGVITSPSSETNKSGVSREWIVALYEESIRIDQENRARTKEAPNEKQFQPKEFTEELNNEVPEEYLEQAIVRKPPKQPVAIDPFQSVIAELADTSHLHKTALSVQQKIKQKIEKQRKEEADLLKLIRW